MEVFTSAFQDGSERKPSNTAAHREPPNRALSGLAESRRGGDAVERVVRFSYW